MGIMLNSEDSLDSSTKSDHLYSNTKSLKRKMEKNNGKRGEAILAIYGDEDYFNSEPLIQKRVRLFFIQKLFKKSLEVVFFELSI